VWIDQTERRVWLISEIVQGLRAWFRIAMNVGLTKGPAVLMKSRPQIADGLASFHRTFSALNL